tara:strand:- start:216 stop:455 length:240 start_codon:yes stop_codon:yes gene_type:complete
MSDYKFFKDLDPKEEEEYRQWARDNYTIGDTINSVWHPVVVDECMNMLIGRIDDVARKEQSKMGRLPKTMGSKNGEGDD